jgi:hypothetical protein
VVKRQDVVDPIVLNKFLTNLRLADNDELLSVRDIQSDDKSSQYSYGSQTSIRSNQSRHHSFRNRRNSESDSSDSGDSDPDQNPVQINPGLVVNPALPVAQPQAPILNQLNHNQPLDNINQPDEEVSNSSTSSNYQDADDNFDQRNSSSDENTDSESDDSSEYRLGQLFDLVEGNKEDEILLRDLLRKEDNLSSSSDSQTIRQKLLDLEKLIISPNDDIRHQAEYELERILDQHKKDQEQGEVSQKKSNSDESESESEKGETETEKEGSPISEKSEPLDSEDSLSKISEKNELSESDEGSMASAKSHTTVYSIEPDDSWPNPSEIPPPRDDRQRQSIVQIDTPGCRITVSPENLPPIPPPRPREIRGRSRRDIYEWVSQSPNTPKVPAVTPQVDRRGRVIKPRTRYCPEDEEERQKELRQRARQRLQESNKAGRAEANFQNQQVTPAQNTSRIPSPVEGSTSRYDTKITGTRPKTQTESKATGITETPVSKKTRRERPASATSKKSGTSKRSQNVSHEGWK